MAIEIVSFPMKNGGSFHSYVSLPKGNSTHLTLTLTVWDYYANMYMMYYYAYIIQI